MRPVHVDLPDARRMLVEQLADFDESCSGLVGADWLDPSRCRGWSRLDLLVHVRMGLDEMAATAGVRTHADPDHDAAGYWTGSPPPRAEDQLSASMWLRRTASAYSTPDAALRHYRDAASRARRVVEAVPDGAVTFQGTVMSLGDFLATWVVEVVVHQLDLDVGGTPAHVPLARRTLEAVADCDLPADVEDSHAVLAALGRVPWPAEWAPLPSYPITL